MANFWASFVHERTALIFFNATVPFCFLLSASKFNPNWKSEAEKGESRMKKMKEQSLR